MISLDPLIRLEGLNSRNINQKIGELFLKFRKEELDVICKYFFDIFVKAIADKLANDTKLDKILGDISDLKFNAKPLVTN
jgi:hypothetical protein